MTVAEFLGWPGDGSRDAYELIDGEPRAMAPASITHGIIQATTAALLRNHLAGTPCRVVTAPGIVPRIRSAANMRVPDLAVNCTPDEAGQRALPDPILIVEILSPSNEPQTRENETRENVWAYASIPSVRDILLLASTGIEAELLHRAADGAWPAQPEIIGPEDELVLGSIDLRLPLSAFYADTHLRRP